MNHNFNTNPKSLIINLLTNKKCVIYDEGRNESEIMKIKKNDQNRKLSHWFVNARFHSTQFSDIAFRGKQVLKSIA